MWVPDSQRLTAGVVVSGIALVSVVSATVCGCPPTLGFFVRHAPVNDSFHVFGFVVVSIFFVVVVFFFLGFFVLGVFGVVPW